MQEGVARRTELVDVVDDDDRVVATVSRVRYSKEPAAPRGSIAVLGSDGRLLVHRTGIERRWPGMWDIAAGGVVAAGETYEDAARRGLLKNSE